MRVFVIILMFLFFNADSYGIFPQTFVLNREALVKNKLKSLLPGSDYNKAKKKLQAKADAILAQNKVYSVTIKNTAPDGGTVNDFYSMAPYWWPDESKSNKLPYIRKDGKINPETKKIMDGKMLIDVSTDVYNLGLAYYFTNDEKYAAKVSELIRVFFLDPSTKMNPNLNFAQVVRGGANGGAATISTPNLIKLIDGVQLVQGSESFSASDKQELQKWFGEFSNWFLTNKRAKIEGASKTNVSTYYTAQVTDYLLFAGKSDEAKEVLKAQSFRHVEEQLDSKGQMHEELKRAKPWSYVMYNMQAFDYLAALANVLDVDLVNYVAPNGASLAKTFTWAHSYLSGAKTWSYSKENVVAKNKFSAIGKHVPSKNVKAKAMMSSNSDVDIDVLLN